MDPATSPLVLTKIHLPAARRRLVSRAHLLDLLESENAASLILVCAPAGYGKTTLLAEWAQSLLNNQVAVAWYALDCGDDDPILFGSYLVASLLQALGPIPEFIRLARLLNAAPEMDLRRLLILLINAILALGQDCVLILDDYHLITAPAIHDALVFLLERQPENLRIVIGSRSDPPFPLAGLRARGKLLEVRAAGLRFSVAESNEFLNGLMQLGLSPQGIATLAERTEGWIAGLQLAALSLAGREGKEQVIASFSGSHRYLVDYLMDEVFKRQSTQTQIFLLSTSILERFCAPLCDAILMKSSPSVEILRELEQGNLFVLALDDRGTWYRYHHLFRDFLLARLNTAQAEQVARLHRAASEWLAGQGFLREAADHAFQTQDWEYAAAFVEQHSFTQIIHSDISTINRWCSLFPEAVMQNHPMLCLQQALSLAYTYRRKNRSRVEERLQQVDQMIARSRDSQLTQGLVEFAGVVRTFLAFAPDPLADPQGLLGLGKSMSEAYPEGDPGQFSGLLLTGYACMASQDTQAAERAFETARRIARRERLYYGVVESSFNLARVVHNQGQLRRATEICQRGQADIAAMLAHPEQELPALGSLDIALGCVRMDQGRLEEAEKRLRDGLNLLGAGMNPYYLMTACIALFQLCTFQGRPAAEALQFLDHLETAWPDIAFLTGGLRAMGSLRSTPDDAAARARAERWCDSFSATFDDEAPLPGLGPFGATEAYALARTLWVQAQIVAGKAPATRLYLAQQLDLASAQGLVRRTIELSLLEALASQAGGDSEGAHAALERALGLAQPEGYPCLFDLGPAMIRLLAEEARQGNFKEYAGRILSVLPTPAMREAGQIAQTLYGESLSERELEVLRLLAQGATNQEIAERLVITVGTVKSHINHILGKLDAHNRTAAVARARTLGLLES